VQHPCLRGDVVFPGAAHATRPRRAGTGRGDVQGIRAAGRQYVGGDPGNDRVAGDRQVRAQRSRAPAASPAQGDRGLDRRVPTAERGGGVTPVLPTEFADLEPFTDWCLTTESQRYVTRLASSMSEMKAFYDAITPRAEESLSYCDKFPLDDLPDDVLNLM